jgi:hypothetical protein
VRKIKTQAMEMTDPQALRLAIALAEAEIQRVAFDANLRDQLQSDCPVTIKASAHREKLRAAIARYEGMIAKEKCTH